VTFLATTSPAATRQINNLKTNGYARLHFEAEVTEGSGVAASRA